MPSRIVVVLGFVEGFQHAHVAVHHTHIGLLFEPVRKALNFQHKCRVGNAVVLPAINGINQRLIVANLLGQCRDDKVKVGVLINKFKTIEINFVEGEHGKADNDNDRQPPKQCITPTRDQLCHPSDHAAHT